MSVKCLDHERPTNSNDLSEVQCLDLDAIFARTDIPDLAEGTFVAELDRRSDCETCCFLSQSRSINDHTGIPKDYQLRAFNCRTLLSDGSQGNSIPTPLLTFKLLPLIADADEFPLESVIESDLILRVAPQIMTVSSADAYYGRRVRRDHGDFPMVRSWLDHCESGHNRRCAASAGIREGISADAVRKVIDCSTGEVVQYTGGKYATLSFCIGPNAPTRC